MTNQTSTLTPNQERVLSPKEVGVIFNRSAKTVWAWHAKQKCFPAPDVKLNNRTIGWKKSTIDAFLANQGKC
jgi:predicted DNA-binding transcriptional regulator AlpA